VGQQAWGNPAEGADRQVGAEPELLPHIGVAERLEFVLGTLFVLPAYISDVVTGVSERLHRRFDVLLLVRSSHELARYGLDALAHPLGDNPHQSLCSKGRIPPTTKDGGLPALTTPTVLS